MRVLSTMDIQSIMEKNSVFIKGESHSKNDTYKVDEVKYDSAGGG